MNDIVSALTAPENLYSCPKVLGRPSPASTIGGIYAWYFKEIPPGVPTDGCVVVDGKTLLYVGKSSSQGLRTRFEAHCSGIARRSTLRMSLGVLLYGQDSTPLRMESLETPNKFSLTDEYEKELSKWMRSNAFVSWVVHKNPAEAEAEIIREFSPPFNIQNGTHSFRHKLKQMRTDAQHDAKKLPPLK